MTLRSSSAPKLQAGTYCNVSVELSRVTVLNESLLLNRTGRTVKKKKERKKNYTSLNIREVGTSWAETGAENQRGRGQEERGDRSGEELMCIGRLGPAGQRKWDK